MVQVLCEDLHNHTLSLCRAPLQNLPMRKTFNIINISTKKLHTVNAPMKQNLGRKVTQTQNTYTYTTKTHVHSNFFPTPFCFIQFLNFHLPRNPRYCPVNRRMEFSKNFFRMKTSDSTREMQCFCFSARTCLDGWTKFHYYILSRWHKKPR